MSTVVEKKAVRAVSLTDLQTNFVSIKKTLESEQLKQSEDVEAEVGEVNTFTLDQLKMAWKNYAFKMKGQGSYYSALIKYDPVLMNEVEVSFEIDNKAQEDLFTTERINLLTHLRKELKNNKISLQIKLTEHVEDKYMSNSDKFKVWAEENKSLKTFRKMFNLDIDY